MGKGVRRTLVREVEYDAVLCQMCDAEAPAKLYGVSENCVRHLLEGWWSVSVGKSNIAGNRNLANGWLCRECTQKALVYLKLEPDRFELERED